MGLLRKWWFYLIIVIILLLIIYYVLNPEPLIQGFNAGLRGELI